MIPASRRLSKVILKETDIQLFGTNGIQGGIKLERSLGRTPGLQGKDNARKESMSKDKTETKRSKKCRVMVA